MIRTISIAALIAACTNHPNPRDPSIETTFPATAAVTSLPRELRVVTFNVHMESGLQVVRGITHDRALRDADLIVLEEIHRSGTGCSAACALAHELGFYGIYAPGHAAGDGDDGVAIVSRAPIRSAEVIELPHFDVHFNGGRRIAIAATIEL